MDTNTIQRVLALCKFHYCDFSKLSKNIWLMRFYVLFISLLRSICLMQLFPSPKSCIRRELFVFVSSAANVIILSFCQKPESTDLVSRHILLLCAAIIEFVQGTKEPFLVVADGYEPRCSYVIALEFKIL